MTEHYHVVPWFNSKEWYQVYDNIYSTMATFTTKQEALEMLLVWKARCPSLPSSVETTLTLLEVHIQDLKNTNDHINENMLRLAYSSAIMRFVNHMLDSETSKGVSLYQAAKNLGIPDWIVDMRHDTAHSNNLPSIEILREACSVSLNWLQGSYWDKYKLIIADYVSGQKEIDSCDENKISTLMNLCVTLSICSHPRNKIKSMSDISNFDMRGAIISDVSEILGDQVDLSNLTKVSVSGIINSLNNYFKKRLKSKDINSIVTKVLLGEESLFLSLDLLQYIEDGDFGSKNRLSKEYVQCFEVLLTFLHTHDLLLDFLMELIKISEANDAHDYRSKLAALWVLEILKALGKSKLFLDKFNKINPGEAGSKNRKELILLFHHWFPNEKLSKLLLDLQKPIPQELMNIHFIQPIISAYNPNLTYFIKNILNFVKPSLPKPTVDKICTLAKLIASPESFPLTASRIYTVDDINMEDKASASADNMNDSDSDVICESDNKPETSKDPSTSSISWKLASCEHKWSSCPIGLLPWQQYESSVKATEDMET
ncbi:uncharacterized protein LOC126370927 [Pectinophora gossypiella]|uniref:uncharacterized protein LOC126370927 n=1 Tax=Pectinophora gossypiella TaxID=13191 RepID=UPI00214F40CD|nr:uncharacterized protein LOC126370927 [Pectinophora gossypiella]